MLRAALVLLSAAAVSGAGIGDKLFRTYTKYVDLPMTAAAASAAGWKALNGGACDPRYGVQFSNGADGLDRHHPTSLYYNKEGEVSGITVDLHGDAPPQKLINMGFFQQVSSGVYRVGVSFRANPCAPGSNGTYPLGDRVVVAPGGANLSLPLNRSAAVAQKWHPGSCFDGMGTHHFYDVATAPKMSWQAENLLPVVTMYNNNDEIQAIFFASWTVQEQIGYTDDWEPIPLENHLMCKNTCDADCTFHGTHFWSTYHVYFKDLSKATCHDGCKIGCCK